MGIIFGLTYSFEDNLKVGLSALDDRELSQVLELHQTEILDLASGSSVPDRVLIVDAISAIIEERLQEWEANS